MSASRILACLLIFSQVNLAQNLVPDSSFEHNKAIPLEFSQINLSYTWNMPSLGTSDLFCACNKKKRNHSLVNVPHNPMGVQYPHSGTCYGGIFAHSHGVYREYLQTPLTEPLEKGKAYRFSMYVSLADFSRVSVSQLGVCFMRKKTRFESTQAMFHIRPKYIHLEKEVGNDTVGWHRVSVTYLASGGENYLLIGSFNIGKLKKTGVKAPKSARTRINQTTERDAYYYIDDVSLVEVPFDHPVELKDSTISIEDQPEVVMKVPENKTMTFKHVLFEVNESTLLPSSYAELDLLAEYLLLNDTPTLEISGHTDNSGDAYLNLKLSKNRAKAIEDYLFKKGIPRSRIESTGYGSSRPLVPNDTEEHRKQNRRVEFFLKN